MAAIKSFSFNFTAAKMKGCLFHFGQSIAKKFRVLGLAAKYQSDKKTRQWFRSIFILALLPPPFIGAHWRIITATLPSIPQCKIFLDYFARTYMNSRLFNPEFFNHFDTVGTPRTNNNVEGYNLKLKKFVGAANPHIYKAIKVFQREELAGHYKYVHANAGKSPPPRKRLDTNKAQVLQQVKKMFVRGEIPIETYVSNIENEYDFLSLDRWKLKKQAKAAAANPSLIDSDYGDSEDSEDLSEEPQDIPDDMPHVIPDDLNPLYSIYSEEELNFFR